MGVRMFESKTNSWLSIFSIEPSLCPILGGRRVSVKGQQQQVRLVFSMKTVFSFDPSMRFFLAERMIGTQCFRYKGNLTVFARVPLILG